MTHFQTGYAPLRFLSIVLSVAALMRFFLSTELRVSYSENQQAHCYSFIENQRTFKPDVLYLSKTTAKKSGGFQL